VENQVSTAQFDAWFWVVLLRVLRFPPQQKIIKREKKEKNKKRKERILKREKRKVKAKVN